MPKRYAREFRRSACERLVAGEKATSLSKGIRCFRGDPLSLEAPGALVDAGLREGVKSFEADELTQAYKTIAELEADMEATVLCNARGCRRQGLSPR